MKVNIQKHLGIIWRWLHSFLWRREAIYGLFLLFLLATLVYFLSIVPKNAAPIELETVSQTSSSSQLKDNPLSLPHKSVSYVLVKISASVRVVRAVSIVFFGLSIVALYRILKRWHSDKVALFSATLFATNAVALSVGRLATPLVLLFGWSLVISLLLWLQHGSSRRVAPFLLASISAGLLYVPGAPYFFILLAVLFGKKITNIFKSMTKGSLIFSITALLAVSLPLIISFVIDFELFKQWLLLPSSIDWGLVPRNILRVPSAFIYRSPVDPIINVGRLPVFDVAAGGFFLIGLYAYKVNVKLERTRVMLLSALFAILLGALGQVTTAIVLVLPFGYAVVGAGISYILDSWYSIFPKNPFARSFGLMMITFVVVASSYYQLTKFFVVWPQTPATRSVYSESRIIE